VARFATLAILEDMDAILAEFFVTATAPGKNPLFMPDDDDDDEEDDV